MHKKPLSLPYTIKIIGTAGDGILTIADMLLHTVKHSGLFGSFYREYPSNIRGGYTASVLRVSTTPIFSPLSNIDCLFIRSPETLVDELSHCNQNATLLFDSTECAPINIQKILSSQNRQDILATALCLQANVGHIDFTTYFSSIILGVLGNYLSLPLQFLKNALCNHFKERKEVFINNNVEMVSKGYTLSISAFTTIRPVLSKPVITSSEYSIIDGNEAIGQGALASGCSFFASYPITPSNGIGNFLARSLPSTGGVSYQAEDEIAAIGTAIGASFSGVKSMTATSGPGLSLMQEFIGYASMVELPLVIVDVQRSGPSTGAPTKFGQEDLFASVMGTHGDSPRIVLAPISVEDCYLVTIEAFNYAEQYQCPVIVLSDGVIASTKKTVPLFPSHIETVCRDVLYSNDSSLIKETTEPDDLFISGSRQFKRYKLSDNGLNPIPVPGISPVAYCATGVEHDELGAPTDSPDMHTRQQKRRFHKISAIESVSENLLEWDYDLKKSEISIISWGITASIVKDTVRLLRADGIGVTALYPRLLFPVCESAINRLLTYSTNCIVVESNFSGQYAKLIRMYTGAQPHSITSYSGIPFTPEILHQVISPLAKKWNTNKYHV